jgi:hypothetical protein
VLQAYLLLRLMAFPPLNRRQSSSCSFRGISSGILFTQDIFLQQAITVFNCPLRERPDLVIAPSEKEVSNGTS